MTQSRILQSIFPDLPREQPVIDKEGNFNNLWSLGLSQLFQALQVNFKNEGIVFPPLTPSQQATIAALYASYVGGTYQKLAQALPDISGQTVYDPVNNVTQQFLIGQDSASPPNVIFAEWVPLSVMITFPRNPNYQPGPPIVLGAPGALNWLCYDTADKELFICTTKGSSTTAVWTQV